MYANIHQYRGMGQMHVPPLGNGAAVDFDAVKQQISQVEKTLQNEIDRATIETSHLRAKKIDATNRLSGAKKRLAYLRELGEALCDGCWAVLPAISHQLGGDQIIRRNLGVCHWCGVPLSFGYLLGPSSTSDLVGLPPLSASIIQKSQATRENVESFLRGEPLMTAQGLGFGNTQVMPNWTSTPPLNSFGTAPALLKSTSGNDHANKTFTKKQTIERENAQVIRLEKLLEQINHALEQWKKYKLQHEEEKRKAAEVKSRANQQEREHLEERLAMLNGVPATVASRENKCSICLEGPKQIAFSCGHRCCHVCSQKIITCHSCRTPIIQRIRLFD